MEIDLSRFREVFFEEASEHLATLEAALLAYEAAPDDRECLATTFRGVHSIKGGAGMFGLDEVVRFSHALENLLDSLRSGSIEFDGSMGNLLLRSADALRGIIAAAREGGAPPSDVEPLMLALAAASGTAATAQEPEAAQLTEAAAALSEFQIFFRPSSEVFRSGFDPLLILRDLEGVGTLLSVQADLSALPDWGHFDPAGCWLAWSMRVETRSTADELRDLFLFVEDGATLRITPVECAPAAQAEIPVVGLPPAARPAHAAEASSVRVPTDKVDKLVDLVGELVIAQSIAGEILAGFTPERQAELLEAFSSIERNTRELQERVMAIRMQPVGGVFSRFPRLVRDLSAQMGKQIALEIRGEETELDKSVIERLADPLTHLVRNAVDHGIEPGNERLAAGKAEQGHVALRAWHEEGRVILEVADDGRGLNLDAIRRKAETKGWLAPGDACADDDLHSFIFRAGFSTAATVTDVSGRGVGMDVVRSNVDALNGAVSVSSRNGHGTTVRIKLPLTLAILDGLLVRTGSQMYVLPLASLVESMRPRQGDVHTLAGKGELLVVRDKPLPLLRLASLFGVCGAEEDPERAAVVIFEHEGRRRALMVDELLGQQQVVVKSLEAHFRKVQGAMGATILGDGRAALILDAAGIVGMSERRG